MWPSENQMTKEPRCAFEALKHCLDRLLKEKPYKLPFDDIHLAKAVADWVIQDMIKLKAAQDMNEVSELYLQGTRDMVRLGRIALERENDNEEVKL